MFKILWYTISAPPNCVCLPCLFARLPGLFVRLPACLPTCLPNLCTCLSLSLPIQPLCPPTRLPRSAYPVSVYLPSFCVRLPLSAYPASSLACLCLPPCSLRPLPCLPGLCTCPPATLCIPASVCLPGLCTRPPVTLYLQFPRPLASARLLSLCFRLSALVYLPACPPHLLLYLMPKEHLIQRI